MEEKRIYYVYKHYLDNPDMPFYIGRGCYRRWERKHTNGIYLKYINQFQDKKINMEIIKDNLTWSESNNSERSYIKLYGRIGYEENGILCNRTLGGSGSRGCIPTEQTRKKLGTGSKKRKGKSFEEQYGLDKANEMKEKLSSDRKGKTLEEQYGLDKSNEICDKISKSLSWDKNPFYNKKHTPESILLISLSSTGRDTKWKGCHHKPETIIKLQKPKSEESKINYSNSAKNRTKKTCPICGKTMDSSNFSKYGHGENCKKLN